MEYLEVNYYDYGNDIGTLLEDALLSLHLSIARAQKICPIVEARIYNFEDEDFEIDEKYKSLYSDDGTDNENVSFNKPDSTDSQE